MLPIGMFQSRAEHFFDLTIARRFECVCNFSRLEVEEIHQRKTCKQVNARVKGVKGEYEEFCESRMVLVWVLFDEKFKATTKNSADVMVDQNN